MSYSENQNKYLELFANFCNCSIDAVNFEKCFSKFWESDRDELYDKKNNWERPFDLELQNALVEERISKEEFSKQWRELYGLTDEMCVLCDILDRTYTTCNCFWPDIPDDEVDPPIVLNETLFRDEIRGLFRELKLLCEKIE